MDIDLEFYEHVDRVARSTGYRWEDLDWEDIRQDVWVYLLENPNELNTLMVDDPDTRDKKLRRICSQRAVAEMYSYELSSGHYIYGTDEVREMLKQQISLKQEFEMLEERTDLALGMLELKQDNPSYFDVIVEKYFQDEEQDNTRRKTLTRGIEKLTQLMNQNHNAREYGYDDGPGSRTVLSNSTSQAITNRDW